MVLTVQLSAPEVPLSLPDPMSSKKYQLIFHIVIKIFFQIKHNIYPALRSGSPSEADKLRETAPQEPLQETL